MTEQAEDQLSIREASLPPKVRELRQKLGQKAKQQKRFRFYSLYALVCRRDVLQAAWEAVQRNGGAPGVDGVSIEQIAATPEKEAMPFQEMDLVLGSPKICNLLSSPELLTWVKVIVVADPLVVPT